MDYAHKINELHVGKRYMVAHARIKFSYGQMADIPVLPNKHTDKQFGYAASFEHYHIDGRFDMPKSLTPYFRMEDNGKSNCVVYVDSSCVEDTALYKVTDIVYKVRKCKRLTTGTMPPMLSRMTGKKSEYLNWYNRYVGKSCRGKKCPHFGTNMIDKGDGVLVCPMHDIHASSKTLKVIEHPRREQHNYF